MIGDRGDTAELRALLVLDQLSGVGLARLRLLVDRFGSGERALRAPRSAFTRLAGEQAALERGDDELGARVDRALDRARKLGLAAVSWNDAAYPVGLLHLADPPPVLFLSGATELLATPGVAIVGARRSTVGAREVAEKLGRRLAESGVPVLSGLALGVDGAAHRGALSVNGPTVAVLGTGPDVPYPRTHTELFRRIRRDGLLVSEFLPGTPALPHHFPRRNRILAALARVVVVVEAGVKSGALITVDHALDLGRDVWAVPGPIERAVTEGSNRLIRDGARPLLAIDDFVSEVAPGGVAARGVAAASATEGRVFEALESGALGVDELACELDLVVSEALALLTEMEMRGRVRRLPGMRFGRVA